MDRIGDRSSPRRPGRVIRESDRAEGGVLLIDEPHGLSTDGRDAYDHEAIDALVKGMEDRRDRLMVILCGYPAEMEWMLDANPGPAARLLTAVLLGQRVASGEAAHASRQAAHAGPSQR